MGFIAFPYPRSHRGAIAKRLLPGAEGGNLFMTMLLGVAGAFVGGWLAGWLAGRFFDVSLGGFFEIRTWLIAIAGSVVVLVVCGFLARSQRA